MADNRPFLVRTGEQIKRFTNYAPQTRKLRDADILEDIRTAHAAIYESISSEISPEASYWHSFHTLTLAKNQEYARTPGAFRKFIQLGRWTTDRKTLLYKRPHVTGRDVSGGGVVLMPHSKQMRFVPFITDSEAGDWELEFESGPIELHYGNPEPLIDVTDGDWVAATKTLTKTAAFADYTFKTGDIIRLVSGTGSSPGRFTVASRVDDDAITLTASPGADASNYVFKLFKIDSMVFMATPTLGQLYAIDDYYVGATVYIVSGKGINQYVDIDEFTGSTRLAEIRAGQEWAEVPDDLSVYEIRPWVPGLAGQFDELIAWRASLKYRRMRPDSPGAEQSAVREIKGLMSEALRQVIDVNTDSGPRIRNPRLNRHRQIWPT